MSLRGALPSRPTGEECEAAKEQEEAVEEGQEIAEKAPAPAAAANAGVTNLFVGRLPAGFGNADLKKLFESHGGCLLYPDRFLRPGATGSRNPQNELEDAVSYALTRLEAIALPVEPVEGGRRRRRRSSGGSRESSGAA